MVKTLAVYDVGPTFGKRLADYVSQKEKTPFAAMAFSSLDKLIEYGKNHPIEILLVDESSRALVGDVKAEQVMMLCDGALVDRPDVFLAIYKYQSGNCTIREALASYCNRPVEPALALLGSRVLVVRIYSPVNRCFKSLLALTIGQVMAEKESVLYLDLEEYSGFTRLIDSEYKANLSDVPYLYRQGGYNWMKLKSMISNWGNMDFILPMRHAEDLSQMASEDMAQLIDRIARESGYDRLVVDVGRMGGEALPVLSMRNVVCMPVREDYISAAKIEEFEEYLEETDDARVRGRIQKLGLPRHIDIAKQEGYLEQLIRGEMEDFVRQLLNGKQPEKQGMEGGEVKRESQE